MPLMSLGDQKLQGPCGFVEKTSSLLIAVGIKLLFYVLSMYVYDCTYLTVPLAMITNTYTMRSPFLVDSNPGSLVLESVLCIIMRLV